MALKGKAGPALGIAAFGSFIAGTFSVVGLMFLAGPLATAALEIRPPEFFSLVLMGLTLATYLSQKVSEKAFMSALIGMLFSWVGIDLVNGTSRFTFGLLELSDGVGVIPLVMGLFGISEVFLELEKNDYVMDLTKTKITNLLPNREEWRQSAGPIARGSVLGFFLGILPGAEESSRISCPTLWRSAFPNTPNDSERERLPGWRDRKRPIMLRPEAPSSPFFPWEFR